MIGQNSLIFVNFSGWIGLDMNPLVILPLDTIPFFLDQYFVSFITWWGFYSDQNRISIQPFRSFKAKQLLNCQLPL